MTNQNNKIPLYRRYGALLSQICIKTSLDKKSLHKALKRVNNIESLRDLTRRELYEYILEIEIFFASEYGIEFGDEEETLSEYLKKNENKPDITKDGNRADKGIGS